MRLTTYFEEETRRFMARKILYKYYATFLAQKYFIEDKFRYNRNALNGSLSSKGKEKKKKTGT